MASRQSREKSRQTESLDLQRLHAHWDDKPERFVRSPALRRFRPANAGTTTYRLPRKWEGEAPAEPWNSAKKGFDSLTFPHKKRKALESVFSSEAVSFLDVGFMGSPERHRRCLSVPMFSAEQTRERPHRLGNRRAWVAENRRHEICYSRRDRKSCCGRKDQRGFGMSEHRRNSNSHSCRS